MARRGAEFEAILTHYYTGVEVDRVQDPGPIDVGIGWARSSAAVQGAFRIVDGRGRTVVGDALGTWRFGALGTGAVSIDPPKGWGLPLRIGVVDAPEQVAPGGVARMTVALSKPARVRTVSGAGESPLDVADAGKGKVEWFAPETPGRYTVRVEATVGDTTRRSEAVEIIVAAPSGEADPTSVDPEPEGGGGSDIYLVIGLLVVLIILVGKTLAGRIRG